jgi:hypothetical protein
MEENVKYELEIVQDEYAESPDSWGDDNLFLVYDHRQFTIKRKGFEPKDIFNHLDAKRHIEKLVEINGRPSIEVYGDDLNSEYENYWIYVVNAYIHSGVALSLGKQYPFNDQWDTSTTGYILVSKKEWKDEDKAKETAENLIETWNMYLSGDVWGYVISRITTCSCCNKEDKQEVDSCYGFYGEEECRKEGEDMLKHKTK